MTLGSKGTDEEWPYQGAIDVATSFGNIMIETKIDEVVHDEDNKIISTPAYMKGTATPAEVFESVKGLVDAVVAAQKS